MVVELMFAARPRAWPNVAELRDLVGARRRRPQGDGRRAAARARRRHGRRRARRDRHRRGVSLDGARRRDRRRRRRGRQRPAGAGRGDRRPAPARRRRHQARRRARSRKLSIGARAAARPALRHRRPARRGHRRAAQRGHEPGPKRIGKPPFWVRGRTRPAAIDANARELVARVRHPDAVRSTRTPARSPAATSRRSCSRASCRSTRKVVVFNKPTYGLDVKTTAAVRARIRELGGRRRRRRARHLHRPRRAARALRPRSRCCRAAASWGSSRTSPARSRRSAR